MKKHTTTWGTNGVGWFRRDDSGFWWAAYQIRQRPPRWVRKVAKLEARGTFRSRRNKTIERTRTQQIFNRRFPGVHIYA